MAKFQQTLPRPLETQAERVFAAFGGPYKLLSFLNLVSETERTKACVYRWGYPKRKGGSNGIIPAKAWPDIVAAAELAGVKLGPDQFDPRPRPRERRSLTTPVEAQQMRKP